jgi:hypothetical protein
MKKIFGLCTLLVVLMAATLLILEPTIGISGQASAKINKGFTDSFRLEDCDGFSTTGRNAFFVLEPGYQLVLEGSEGRGRKEQLVHLTITVSDTTKTVNLEIGGVPTDVVTRVIEEVETKAGELTEISRNYFAICNKTNTVFYFGEAVDIYENGQIIDHAGSWEAGVDGAMPGIVMPGVILLGGKYLQEVAPNIAMDRAEIISMNEEVTTPAGTFRNCLKTKETSALERGKGYKYYAPGIGLVNDGKLNLIGYGPIP